MRPVLLRFFLDEPWVLWKVDAVTQIGGPGVALVLSLLTALYIAWSYSVFKKILEDDRPILIGVGLAVAALTGLAIFRPGTLPPSVPLFGYGATVLAGVLSALWLTKRRAIKAGFDPEIVIDLALWLVVGGVLGGRIAYLVQFHDHVFVRGMTLPQALFAAINLTAGGLVLIGAMVGGFLGMFAFCRARGHSLLRVSDLIIPSVFVGVGFGRIGCLLNGCCYGEPCSLPWAITFPAGSLPFNAFVELGMLDPTAPRTMPIHPTQIYSSLDGFLEAAILAWFYWHKRRDGEVFAFACLMYSTSRFLMEFLRGDSPGVFSTPLTISQVYSIGMFAAGLALWVWLSVRPKSAAPASTSGTPHAVA